MLIPQAIDRNVYINGRSRDGGATTDVVSEMGNVSVMSLTSHSTRVVRKYFSVYAILREGNINILINYT